MWVEAKATRTNDVKIIINFVKSHIFDTFRILKAIISDHHNRSTKVLLCKYHITHCTFFAYHP